ncbi:MAG: hypothetical protein M3O03_01705 [Pseudomonadota bacterium]|nr:hypothetical protein [Pseudomonadota bacterium]
MLVRSCYGLAVGVAVTILSFSIFSKTTYAEDYPYSGYFSVQMKDSSPGFKQAKCALEFYKQNSDGTATDYFLDTDKFKKNGIVSYFVVDRNTCTYYPSTKSDSCTATSYDHDGTRQGVQFDLYESLPPDDFSYVNFADDTELNRFAHSTQKSLPNDKFPTAIRFYVHRCEGFDDSALYDHLTEHVNTLSEDETYDVFAKPIEKGEIPLVLDIMQKIGKPAFNATMPGQ